MFVQREDSAVGKDFFVCLFFLMIFHASYYSVVFFFFKYMWSADVVQTRTVCNVKTMWQEKMHASSA